MDAILEFLSTYFADVDFNQVIEFIKKAAEFIMSL